MNTRLLTLVFACAAVQAQVTVNTAVVASTGTPIPAGKGGFTTFSPNGLPADPCISNGNVAFAGGGTNQQGVYALLFGSLVRVADLTTSIPGGSGKFVAFSSSPCISGANVVFVGNGLNNQQGIYAAFPIGPGGTVVKVVDTNTLIPGGSGDFVSFPPCPTRISGGSVAFLGNGLNNQQGIYAAFPGVSAVLKVADLNTLIPGGSGDFVSFPGCPGRISGVGVGFIGDGLNNQTGIYAFFPGGPGARLVDTSTAIPGDPDNRTFTTFLKVAAPPNPIGGTVAFVGGAAFINADNLTQVAQEGVYTVHPPVPIGSSQPVKVADLGTLVPGSTVTFSSFGNVAIDPDHVVFDAFYSPDGVTTVHGLFTNVTGTLSKLLDNTQSIGGKQLADFSFGSNGFSGNHVAFFASFTDGSQGIGTATVNGNKCAGQGVKPDVNAPEGCLP